MSKDETSSRAESPFDIGPEAVADYVRINGLDELIGEPGPSRPPGLYESVDPDVTTPMPPQWPDLVRLHQLMRSRKVTTALELGVGKSTLVIAHALSLNSRDYGSFVSRNLRRANPFELHSVDDMVEYIDVTRDELPISLRKHVTFHHSACQMASFGGRVCTFYEAFPNVCPDFIYVDGPSQFAVEGDVRGLSTRHPDRLPMSGDLLAIEHFLLPGTMILLDGRTANARFLRANFQRDWSYQHYPEADVHTFELTEPPLGRHNRKQIEFCLGTSWLVEFGTDEGRGG